MAQYTPKHWTASAVASREFRACYSDILKLVQQKARKYFALASITNADLVQEGMIAALYAIDSFDQTRGFKREAYIARLVDNALMMVVAESRSQCRQPYAWVKDDPNDKGEVEWRRVPAMEFAEPDDVNADDEPTMPEAREAELERADRAEAERARLAAVRKELSPAAKLVFDCRTEPPPVLFVIARNLAGRNVGENARMPNEAIAQYLNMEASQVAKALREVKNVVERRYHRKAVRQ